MTGGGGGILPSMLTRHRLSYVALGGCLTVILGVSLALAQGNAPKDLPKLAPTVEKGQGVAKKAPAPESKAANKARDQKAPTAKPAPAAPVKKKRPAKPTCDARCQAAQQREKDDLVSQRSMAQSAAEIITVSWWQFGAGVLGILLLVGTLIYTRNAVVAATDTVTAMRRSERAYVTISHKPPGLDLDEKPGFANFTIEVKNHGRTPATVTDVLIHLDRFTKENPAPDQPIYRTYESRMKVGAFLVAGNSFKRSPSMALPTGADEGELWLYGYVDYVDEFGDTHRGGYARVYNPNAYDISVPLEERNNLAFVAKAGWNYDSDHFSDKSDKSKNKKPG